jgi:2-keto-4-pentenoate hydratase/2-oxohepta-3-ene-1,7-dioic acid hydratase in catechol pathway
MSSVVVTADMLLPRWQTITGSVRINDSVVARVSANNPRFSLGQALAHVSRDEQLYPGEFFGTGTLPGGSGIENGRLLRPGDRLQLELDDIGSVQHRIVRP